VDHGADAMEDERSWSPLSWLRSGHAEARERVVDAIGGSGSSGRMTSRSCAMVRALDSWPRAESISARRCRRASLRTTADARFEERVRRGGARELWRDDELA